jgi:hypothetical protein
MGQLRAIAATAPSYPRHRKPETAKVECVGEIRLGELRGHRGDEVRACEDRVVEVRA